MSAQLTHLQQLEAESIHIIREVVAEFENPVMLYSIGKDSAVMLHLARKAFFPTKLPFPLLHVDTTWKFREMIEFRDRLAREYGFELLVHINENGVKQGIGPFSHGSAVHTDVMKRRVSSRHWTNISLMRHSAGPAGMKRNRVLRNGSSPFATPIITGIRKVSALSCGTSITPGSVRVKASGSFRCQTGPSLISGSTSTWSRFRLYHSTTPRSVRWSNATAC